MPSQAQALAAQAAGGGINSSSSADAAKSKNLTSNEQEGALLAWEQALEKGLKRIKDLDQASKVSSDLKPPQSLFDKNRGAGHAAAAAQANQLRAFQMQQGARSGVSAAQSVGPSASVLAYLVEKYGNQPGIDARVIKEAARIKREEGDALDALVRQDGSSAVPSSAVSSTRRSRGGGSRSLPYLNGGHTAREGSHRAANSTNGGAPIAVSGVSASSAASKSAVSSSCFSDYEGSSALSSSAYSSSASGLSSSAVSSSFCSSYGSSSAMARSSALSGAGKSGLSELGMGLHGRLNYYPEGPQELPTELEIAHRLAGGDARSRANNRKKITGSPQGSPFGGGFGREKAYLSSGQPFPPGNTVPGIATAAGQGPGAFGLNNEIAGMTQEQVFRKFAGSGGVLEKRPPGHPDNQKKPFNDILVWPENRPLPKGYKHPVPDRQRVHLVDTLGVDLDAQRGHRPSGAVPANAEGSHAAAAPGGKLPSLPQSRGSATASDLLSSIRGGAQSKSSKHSKESKDTSKGSKSSKESKQVSINTGTSSFGTFDTATTLSSEWDPTLTAEEQRLLRRERRRQKRKDAVNTGAKKSKRAMSSRRGSKGSALSREEIERERTVQHWVGAVQPRGFGGAANALDARLALSGKDGI